MIGTQCSTNCCTQQFRFSIYNIASYFFLLFLQCGTFLGITGNVGGSP
jgi:hypothetical protein